MNKLPVLVSVPHGGLHVPEKIKDKFLLDDETVLLCSDVESPDLYRPLKHNVMSYIEADIARMVVDLNRSYRDFSETGVIKEINFNEDQVYSEELDPFVIDSLLEAYYDPYHAFLTEQSAHSNILFGMDCHTMCEEAPPIEDNAGERRPQICLGNNNGNSFPEQWTEIFMKSFQQEFTFVTLNDPFAGGHITRCHGTEMPWIQIETRRGDWMNLNDKQERINVAVTRAIQQIVAIKQAQ